MPEEVFLEGVRLLNYLGSLAHNIFVVLGIDNAPKYN